jgi:hypothetical protein
VTLLTPLLLQASNEVAAFLLTHGILRGSRASGRAVRRLFGAPAPAGGPDVEATATPALGADTDERVDALTVAQWTRVRDIVEEVLRGQGVPGEQAALVAVAVVGAGRLTEVPR